jgi:hypothetical protein
VFFGLLPLGLIANLIRSRSRAFVVPLSLDRTRVSLLHLMLAGTISPKLNGAIIPPPETSLFCTF